MLHDLPRGSILIAAAIAALAFFGYRAVAGTLDGGTAAKVPVASVAPIVVARTSTPIPCACGPSATPSPVPTTQPASTPVRDWFWATDVTPSQEGASSGTHIVFVEVTSARFGTLTATTEAGASCTAAGTYPSGAHIAASGLGQTTADASGFVRWRFFGAPAESGRANYVFTCINGSSRRTTQVLFDIP